MKILEKQLIAADTNNELYELEGKLCRECAVTFLFCQFKFSWNC